MTIRETAIAKLQQLPEPLLQEVSDFIDFIAHKHQPKTPNLESEVSLSEAWTQWFEVVDNLEAAPTKAISEYQQLLLNKYQQQGLDL